MVRLEVCRIDDVPVATLASRSATALDRELRAPGELLVAVPRDEATVLGAFQRPCEAAKAAAPLFRRGSGGAAARVGSGTVWVQLALVSPDAFVDVDASRLLNRYVRPLLRGLGRAGAAAAWFGRDWVSVSKRPAALVSFGHDARSGRALVEAFIAVTTPFPDRERGAFRGLPPATLHELTGRGDVAALADSIAQAYELEYRGARSDRASDESNALEIEPEPPWAATRDEAIGIVAAGPDRTGRLRVGGELMASRDAVARLEDGLAELGGAPSTDGVGALVDGTLAAEGAVVFGVRSLASIRDVTLAALVSPRAQNPA